MSPQKFPARFGLYAILTNPVRGYEYTAEMLVRNGVRCIQLRMKKEPKAEIAAMAGKIRKITEGTRSLFIVNDHPDIARDVRADGVHVGQDDLSYDEVRKIVGPGMHVGLSTHNPGQTRTACAKGPSYIGIGPVHATTTKAVPDPVIGLDGMRAMIACATAPHVAIGGITRDNLRAVLRAGAVNFCSVRPINGSNDPEKALKALLEIYNRECPEKHQAGRNL
jgi:thiamine-phosphate pyrophosphorylase